MNSILPRKQRSGSTEQGTDEHKYESIANICGLSRREGVGGLGGDRPVTDTEMALEWQGGWRGPGASDLVSATDWQVA